MEILRLKQYTPKSETIEAEVPASKSLMSRALLLAAFSGKRVTLRCGELCDDTETLISLLNTLGVAIHRSQEFLTVNGIFTPNSTSTELNVANAGTAARFLPAVLAFMGGTYAFTASEQMRKRPMRGLSVLEDAGVTVEYKGETGTFPFCLSSRGDIGNTITVNADESTQYASGILLGAAISRRVPFTLRLNGTRTQSGYIALTLSILSDFGVKWERTGDEITLLSPLSAPDEYCIEPDLSSASYFYALALLFHCKVFVSHARLNSHQSDVGFLRLLERAGVVFRQTEQGLLADGTAVTGFSGFDEVFTDFSDQTLTAAALAVFAKTPTVLHGVGHIRYQECDRIAALLNALHAMGVPAQSDGQNVIITPSPVRDCTIQTYGDHRVAMAFALVALKTGKVGIENPDCCKKTFPRYFEILSRL